jgi:Protein of unknown function (DUF3638)
MQFYFGHGEGGGDIVIRARGNAKVYEIIPRECFGHDLPSFLVNDYVHWMDVTTGDIEFRQTDLVFQQSSNNWTLSYSPSSSKMKCLGKSLVDLKSTTGREISSIFSAFEKPRYLHITVDETGLGEVYLPRFGFSFFVNNNLELESPDLSAVVDSDQSVGSLVGLRNRLVVRGKSSYGAFTERSVIISLGKTTIARAGDHVKINISLEDMRKVRYFRYHIDPILGQLRASEDLLSRLFKAYLHALSSFVLPDPLTGKTGTEEALQCLREQAVQPLYPLDGSALGLLREIGNLTPQRVFYPKGKKRMQSVSWDTQLSPLSQHDQFRVLVGRIINHSNSLMAFHSGRGATELRTQPLIEWGDTELLERATIQNAVYQNCELGGALASRDEWYSARDNTSWSLQSRKAYQTAYLTRMWSTNMDVALDLRSYFGVEEVEGAGAEPLDNAPLSAVLGILLPRNWGPVHEFCRKHHRDTERYKLQFFLATVAFAHLDSNLRPFHVLLACSISVKLREEKPPPYSNYFPNRGTMLVRNSLLDAVRSTLTSRPGKKQNGASAAWREADVQIEAFVDTAIEKWLSADARIPADHYRWPLINAVRANEVCQRLFQIWYGNTYFLRHLDSITAGLSDFRTVSPVPIPPQLIVTNLELRNTVPRAQIAPRLTEIFSITPFNPPLAPPAPEILPTRDYGLLTIVEKIELNGIATRFSHSDNAIEQKYGQDLCRSLQSLCDVRFNSNPKSIPLTIDNLISYRGACLDYVSDLIVGMQISCGLNSASMQFLRLGGLLPRFTAKALLALIATTTTENIDKDWKRSIINYGIALTMLQRAGRMVRLVLKGDVDGFYQEACNLGHNEWDATEWPDWLLMEIEGNFLIRPIQAQVAFKMMAPSGKNTVTQLNMGEGRLSLVVTENMPSSRPNFCSRIPRFNSYPFPVTMLYRNYSAWAS